MAEATVTPHKELSKLAGEWEGIAKVWFQPDKVEDESPASGTMRPVMDGKFIIHEYKGSFKGKPLEGLAIIGYHKDLKKYQMAWIDSFHTGTGIIFSEGKKEAKEISVLGSWAYVTPEIEQHWGWRTEFDIKGDNEIVITAFNISPSGEEAKATEVVYKRK